MQLPYFEQYEGNGPALLMVHGFLSSRAQWLANLDALRQVCSPVVIELFGHGRAASPIESACYQPDYYVAAFDLIRQQLGIERWSVLGYSLGAALTLRYSLTHPSHTQAQVFTNSTSAFAEPAVTAHFRKNAQQLILQYETGGLDAINAIAVHPRHAKRIPEPWKAQLLADCQQLSPGGVGRTLAHTNGNASVRDLIKNNQVPTLLVQGTREARFEPFRVYAEATMPNLEIVTVDAGHAVNLEAIDAFNTTVTDFLRRH